jgi:hypothetical protein
MNIEQAIQLAVNQGKISEQEAALIRRAIEKAQA